MPGGWYKAEDEPDDHAELRAMTEMAARQVETAILGARRRLVAERKPAGTAAAHAASIAPRVAETAGRPPAAAALRHSRAFVSLQGRFVRRNSHVIIGCCDESSALTERRMISARCSAGVEPMPPWPLDPVPGVEVTLMSTSWAP